MRKVFYKNATRVEMNKEVTRISKEIAKDRYQHHLSRGDHNELIQRAREIEERLNININLEQKGE